jgi:hypothetical protein
MKKVTIYGERCSGTNYLEELLNLNFEVQVVWSYGWKHFFGYNDLSNSDDTLFIGIIRNLEDWVNSLYREKHHLPTSLTKSVDTFLHDTFYSINPNQTEMMTDRNIDSGERYKNIFELRLVKNKYLVDKMPKLVKNYCLITYDDLVESFDDTMNKLMGCGLTIKQNITFPVNSVNYKKNKNVVFKKKVNAIPKEKIALGVHQLRSENDQSIQELIHYETLLFPKTEWSLTQDGRSPSQSMIGDGLPSSDLTLEELRSSQSMIRSPNDLTLGCSASGESDRSLNDTPEEDSSLPSTR